MGAIFFLVLRISIVTALFLFVGWSIYTLWTEINYRRKLASETRTPTIHFKNLYLDIPETEQTATLNFNHSPIYIGRDISCDICLQESTLSARHARIQYHHKQWWIEDLHSSNGTHLNEIPVLSPIVLKTDDHIRCGDVEFVLDIEAR
jgi:pSer/pThr/pTyr-binding forkhead associated (FHA) protein